MICTAVIVTRNRIDLLKLAMERLFEQSRPLDYIVIVDNVSTDGTIEYLKSIESEVVKVIYNEKNEGGAGGFYHGINGAYELGSDYIWIMDDDTIATPTALEELLKGFVVLKDKPVGFITSNVLYKDGTPCYMNISHCVFDWNEYLDKSLVRVSHSSFVSMMITRAVVRELGLPFRDFFIWGDDGEYSTRIANQYEGYICGNSIVYHYMNENKGVDIFNTPADRINRFYYFYRNWMFTHKFRGGDEPALYLKEIEELIHKIKISSTPYKKEKIEVIKKGIKDGKKMQACIDFPKSTGKESLHGAKEEGTKERLSAYFYKIMRNKLLPIDGKYCHKFSYTKQLYSNYKRLEHTKLEKALFLYRGLIGAKIFNSNNKSEAFIELMKNVKIETNKNRFFIYSIDIYKTWSTHGRQMDNCPSDYSLFINNALLDLKYSNVVDNFQSDNNNIIDGIIIYIKRAIKKIKYSNQRNKKNIIKWLSDFIDKPAQSLGDAFQRILIINQVLWQTKHRLVGLGRLDYILNELSEKDKISDNELLELICNFYSALHNYYLFKSDALIGDTGQVIIVGGVDENNEVFENRLTNLFIQAVKRMQLPDPKVLIRVSEETSYYLWETAIDCATTGIGSPLFSNDERVIPALIDYGYAEKDAYNYTTSACWEPIAGASSEQNNIQLINFATPFELMTQKDDLETIKTFDEYLWYYLIHMKGHAMYFVKLLDKINWALDPVMSTFSIGCRQSHVDISQGGGRYNNYGILSIGISNAVNSLLNIKKFVFEDHILSLKDLNEMRLNNFYGHEDVYKMLNTEAKKFGTDNPEVVNLTNYITFEVDEYLKQYKNKFGGGVKFGLSSPSYLTIGELMPATFDGRLKGEPYGVHISADSGVAYTEIMSFASKLNYSGSRFNGNVVDLMVTPDFIKKNKNKFTLMLIKSMRNGIFQLQMNVVSSEVLIKAKADPTFMPNLVVRVWGFSAFFNDLPENYKDMLIERALKNEHSNI